MANPKFKRYPKSVLIAHAAKTPATADYAFGERSGGYTVTLPARKLERPPRVKRDWAFDLAKKLRPGEWSIVSGPDNAPHLVKQSLGNLSRVAALVRRHACKKP